jgi:hypothetical protein
LLTGTKVTFYRTREAELLRHNGNDYAPVSLGHSTRLHKNYQAVSFTLENIKCEEHQWPVCVDLKMVSILLGQQAGYTRAFCVFVFVKALDKNGGCCTYIIRKLPAVSIQKLRAGVLDGPQIRSLTTLLSPTPWTN